MSHKVWYFQITSGILYVLLKTLLDFWGKFLKMYVFVTLDYLIFYLTCQESIDFNIFQQTSFYSFIIQFEYLYFTKKINLLSNEFNWDWFECLKPYCKQAERLKSHKRRPDIDRLNGWWLIGSMVDRLDGRKASWLIGLMVDRLDGW